MNDTENNNENAVTETSESENLKIGQKIIVDQQPKHNTILAAFRNLDKVCYRLGLLNKDSCLATDINWNVTDGNNDLPKILKQLDNTRDQIEQQIVQLKKMMSNRCLKILVWEFIVLFSLITGLLTTSYFMGYWVNGHFSPPWLTEFLSRPILITLSSLLLIGSFVILHYSLRNFFANKIANAVSKSSSKFTLAKAFLINSHFSHSIFRPEPVGLHLINRRRLQKAHELYLAQMENETNK